MNINKNNESPIVDGSEWKSQTQLLTAEIGTNKIPTRKQLERAISQNFYTFNRQKIGCSLGKVTCAIFNTYLVIVAEEATTPLELVIEDSGQTNILLEIRHNINRILKSHLIDSIRKIAMVDVIDSSCELNFDTNRLMATVIMTEYPQVRKKK